MIETMIRKIKYVLFTNGSIIEHELMWANVWKTATANIKWLNNKEDDMLFPGRWAIGYNTMYVLFRVLNDFKPDSVLEFGLGNSTKIITKYFNFFNINKKKHTVIEHNKNWIDFFCDSNEISDFTQIMQVELVEEKYKTQKVIKYEEVEIEGRYSLVLIDGPFGSEGKYSRIDIIKHLPECLKESFVIMIDDYNRRGERGLGKEIMKVLDSSNIKYCTGNYLGESECFVICSENNRFLTSL